MKINIPLDFRKDFCSNCGVKLYEDNSIGKCSECNNVVCNSCGKLDKGRIICIECKRHIEDQLNLIKHKRDIGSLQ